MCKFTKIQKMLENYGVTNYFVQFGEMEIHTTKFYFYMVKVNNGILVKIRQNDMMTYFVDMVVKNQEQAKSIILGYVLESQKYDMEQLKEEMDTPKNDMEKLEFQKMEWFDTMQEEETIVPCGAIEEVELYNMDVMELFEIKTKLLKEKREERKNGITPKWRKIVEFERQVGKAILEYNKKHFKDIFKEVEEVEEIQEEETIVPCGAIEEVEEVDTTTHAQEKDVKMAIVDYVFNKLEKTHDTKKLIDDIIKIFVDAEKDNFTVIGFDFSEYEKNIIDPTLFVKLDMNIPIHKASKKTHKTKRMIYLDDYLLNN